ncbi:MAG: hypothetical protein GW818_03060, partial [Flavobacteriales bacterium]|nr:hypothetical protein [Flavobacteriales bacterium]
MISIKKTLLIVSVALFSFNSNAQVARNGEWCGADQHNEALLENNPALQEQHRLFEEYVQEYTRTHSGQNEKKGGTNDKTPNFIIPVVFHVLTFNGQGYVSKQDIDDAILRLNEDFRRLNSDTSQTRNTTNAPFAPVAVDAKVEFRLAHKDPNGNCTEGIVRVESSLSVDAGDAVKNVSRWDTKKYFNIWTVVNIGGAPSGGGIIAGYAQFPQSGINNTFGVVVDHNFVGRNDRTLSHEIGHCF